MLSRGLTILVTNTSVLRCHKIVAGNMSILVCALFGFILAACAGMNASGAQLEQGTGQVVQAAKKDLAGRLNVRQESIELAGSIEEVTWPDSSLGCPEPGMVYAQVLTPGYRFKLQSGGKLYEYHTGKSVVKLCQQ
jgi:hypothetical protein